MLKVAKFEKVSFEQFYQDYVKNIGGTKQEIQKIYDRITLPKRATTGSAGYDFVSPDNYVVSPRSTILIPSGIRVRIENGYALLLYPRSSLGFKYRMQLNNTVGVIDSDYYNAKNEGHIMFKITNDSNTNDDLILKQSEGMAQGIFTPFAITVDDEVTQERTGGFGSTNKGE